MREMETALWIEWNGNAYMKKQILNKITAKMG